MQKKKGGKIGREEEKKGTRVWPISGKDLGSTFQVN
jgi:hypothetical protein